MCWAQASSSQGSYGSFYQLGVFFVGVLRIRGLLFGVCLTTPDFWIHFLARFQCHAGVMVSREPVAGVSELLPVTPASKATSSSLYIRQIYLDGTGSVCCNGSEGSSLKWTLARRPLASCMQVSLSHSFGAYFVDPLRSMNPSCCTAFIAAFVDRFCCRSLRTGCTIYSRGSGRLEIVVAQQTRRQLQPWSSIHVYIYICICRNPAGIRTQEAAAWRGRSFL